MEQQSYWVQTTDQQRLYVKTWGNANNPVLVLVHGYPDNQEVWEPVIGHLVQAYYIVTYMTFAVQGCRVCRVVHGPMPCLSYR